MNATKWATLTSFVEYLGQMEKAIVEFRDDKWWVTYIDNDPLKRERDRKAAALKGSLRSAEELHEQAIAEQMARALEEEERRGVRREATASSLGPREGAAVGVSMRLAPRPDGRAAAIFADDGEMDDQDRESVVIPGPDSRRRDRDGSEEQPRKRSRWERDSNGTENAKSGRLSPTQARPEGGWVRVGCVVKIINKTVGEGRYYKAKAEVLRVLVHRGGRLIPVDEDAAEDPAAEEEDEPRAQGGVNPLDAALGPGFRGAGSQAVCVWFGLARVAEVRVLESGHTLRLPFTDLETVVPGEGRRVAVVAGRHCDARSGALVEAVLRRADLDRGEAHIEVRGQTAVVGFDDICRVVNW
jgi:hypothetical protein